MPLNRVAALTNGMLTEGDRLSLSTGVFVVGSILADRATGARHRLRPPAALAIKLLHHDPEAGIWCAAVQAKGLTPAQIEEIVGFLYHIGGLRIRRRLAGCLRITVYRLAVLPSGLTPAWAPRRWPANLLGVGQAVSHLLLPFVVSVAALDALIWMTRSLVGPVLLYSTWVVAVFWLSTYAHELAHVLLIRGHRTTAVMMQRGLRLGLLHIPASRGRELCSALCGPLAGVVTATVLGGLTAVSWHRPQLATAGCILAGLHLLALLPIYSDGTTLWKGIFR